MRSSSSTALEAGPEGAEARERSEQTAENADDQAMQLLSDSWRTGVLLDVPVVKVEEISLDVEDLRARVSLSARVGNLVALDVGAEVFLRTPELDHKGGSRLRRCSRFGFRRCMRSLRGR